MNVTPLDPSTLAPRIAADFWPSHDGARWIFGREARRARRSCSGPSTSGPTLPRHYLSQGSRRIFGREASRERRSCRGPTTSLSRPLSRPKRPDPRAPTLPRHYLPQGSRRIFGREASRERRSCRRPTTSLSRPPLRPKRPAPYHPTQPRPPYDSRRIFGREASRERRSCSGPTSLSPPPLRPKDPRPTTPRNPARPTIRGGFLAVKRAVRGEVVVGLLRASLGPLSQPKRPAPYHPTQPRPPYDSRRIFGREARRARRSCSGPTPGSGSKHPCDGSYSENLD